MSLDAALALAAEGKPVFFCGADKRPACPHGFHDAASDPAKVCDLHRLYPGPLVGVATGKASGFDVLDLDAKHGSATEWWSAHREKLPTTRVHRTRSGGLHLLFQHAEGLRNTASKITRGVDSRGDGGYVIWWPANGFEVLSTGPIVAWPSWLLTELLPQKLNNVVPMSRAVQETLDDRKLRGLVRLVAGAPEGQRNQVLYWAACRLAESHAAANITENFAIEVLEAAAGRCGLPVVEARRTIQSAIHRVSS